MAQQKVSEKVQERVFQMLLKRPDNIDCADCSAKGPRWVSLDFGIFICMNCAGAHRTLGPSVSRVRSTKLDGWFQDHIDIMEGTGNAVSNSYWEGNMPSTYNKPLVHATLEDLIRFVNTKYVKKTFVPPNALDPKTAFLANKQYNNNFLPKRALSPFYYKQVVQPNSVEQSKLGDLIEMDGDEFNDYTHQPPVSIAQVNGSSMNNTQISLDEFNSPPLQTKSFQVLPNPTLDFLNLYNQPTQQQSHQGTPINVNRYAYLQNMHQQPQQIQQQYFHPHSYQNLQPNPQFQQQQQQFNYIQQQPPTNIQKTVNIMDLYVAKQ